MGHGVTRYSRILGWCLNTSNFRWAYKKSSKWLDQWREQNQFRSPLRSETQLSALIVMKGPFIFCFNSKLEMGFIVEEHDSIRWNDLTKSCYTSFSPQSTSRWSKTCCMSFCGMLRWSQDSDSHCLYILKSPSCSQWPTMNDINRWTTA